MTLLTRSMRSRIRMLIEFDVYSYNFLVFATLLAFRLIITYV